MPTFSVFYKFSIRMSVGTYLTLHYAPLLCAFKVLMGIMLVLFLAAGIFNSVWVSKINVDIFRQLDGSKTLIGIGIPSAVCGIVTSILFLTLAVILYIFGRAFVVHAIMFTIDMLCLFGDVALMAAVIHFSRPSAEDDFVISFRSLILSGRNEIITHWARENQCSGISCSHLIDDFVHERVYLGFIGNIVFIALIGGSMIAFFFVLFFMSITKPIDRNSSVQSSEEEHYMDSAEVSDERKQKQDDT